MPLRYALLMMCIVVAPVFAQPDTSTVTWVMDRVDSVGGFPATPLTGLPALVESPYGTSSLFDGVNDALLIPCIPLGAATSFTVELFLRPDSNAPGSEERIVHMSNAVNGSRRVLLELRVLPDEQWILDTYIRSEISALTLIDSSHSHTIAAWHHAALTYDNATMRSYVDGVQELSGPVTYVPIDSTGKTSIGARQDPRSWFKGAIRMVRISRRALQPSEFFMPLMGVRTTPEHPAGFALSANYPNPFNPSTSMTYVVPSASAVKIAVYDILGQEVALLVDGLRYPGTYTAVFAPQHLAGGVYFCRMQAGTYSAVRKLVLAK